MKLKKILFIISLLILIIGIPLVYVSLRFLKPAVAGWSENHTSWLQRKQLTLTNNSGATLNSTAIVTVTVNTKALVDIAQLQGDCDDLRIVHETAGELTKYISYPSGETCTTSTATKINFALQASITNGSSDTNYYLYYHNTAASAPTNNYTGFTVGSKNATFVCSFDGTSTCTAAGTATPSTETGAVRYGGSKGALQFDGRNSLVSISSWLSAAPSAYTMESWVYFNSLSASYSSNGFEIMEDGCCGNYSLYVDNSGNLAGYIGGQGAGGGVITINTWHHVAVTYDGSAIRLFLNGSLVGTNGSPGAIAAPNSTLSIGGRGAGNQTWPGKIDEIRVSTSARYTASFTPTTAPFVRDTTTRFLLHLDENGDDPRNSGYAIDDSGNGLHGSLGAGGSGGAIPPLYAAGLIGVDNTTSDTGNNPRQSYAAHEGILIEEGTTNKITNPSIETATTNWSGVETGTGADGACSTSSTITMDAGSSNTCVGRGNADMVNFRITSSVSAGASSVTVSTTPTGLAVGDEILIINLRGTSGANADVGKYETRYITAISTNTLTLDRVTTNAYDGTTQDIMVQRVPQYTTVDIDSGGTMTITAYTTSSHKGGVIFFRARGAVTVDSGGTISANAKGFAGGTGGNGGTGGITYNGTGGLGGPNGGSGGTGEGGGGGSRGDSGSTGGAGGVGGGGGGGSAAGCAVEGGGGGGAYGTVGTGGNGSYPGSNGSGTTGGNGTTASFLCSAGGGGGGTYGSANLSTLFFGSGGGGGGDSSSNTGGIGGGIIFISGSSISVSGTISSDGGAAGTAYGGAGAGGSIYIKAPSTTLGTTLVTATAGGTGAAGGVGRIHVDYTSISGTTSPAADTATITSILSQSSTQKKFGTYSLTAANTSAVSGASHVVTSITATAATHTLSAYVLDGTSGNVGGAITSSVAQLIFSGVPQTTTYTNMGGGWWRLSYTDTALASAQDYGVLVKGGKSLYIDGVQLEAIGYVTTYADGSLGTGYAWTGSAHASTSTRTAVTLDYSQASNLPQSTFTVSMWVKMISGPTAMYRSFLSPAAGKRGQFLAIRVDSGCSNNYRFRFEDNAGNFASSCTAPTLNTWTHLVGTWDGTTLKFYLNGTIGENTDTAFDFDAYSDFGIGYDKTAGNGGPSDSIISDLRIYDNALSANDASDLYRAGLLAHSEGIQVDRFDTGDTKGQQTIASWHMDEANGTTLHDSTIYNNTMTISSATWGQENPTSLPRRTFLKFSGSSQYTSQSQSANYDFGTGSFSISGWFRHDSPAPTSGTHTILSRFGSAGYKIYMNTSGYVCFGIDDDSTWTPDDAACTAASLGSLADSKWHHFEAVKSGTSSIIMYIDGNSQGSDVSLTATGTLNTPSTLYLGIDSDGSSNAWNGALDEFNIYNYARSAAQVKADRFMDPVANVLGENTTESLSQGLVGYWKLDESSWNGTSSEVVDSSGNGLNGTATGVKTGTSTGSNSSTTLNDTNSTFETNGNYGPYGQSLVITGGTGSGQTRTISTITATQLTVSAAWSVTPDATSTYAIRANTTSSGKFSRAGYFTGPGADTHVSLGTSSLLSPGANSFSISMWVNIHAVGSDKAYLFSKGSSQAGTGENGEYVLGYTTSTDEFFFGVYSAGNDASAVSVSADAFGAINSNTWYYVSGGFDAASKTLFIQVNDKENTTAFTSTVYQSSTPTAIGARGTSPTNTGGVNGYIDEVRYYSRAITRTERDLLAEVPPVGYWSFEEGSGLSVADSSGNGLTGTSIVSNNIVQGKYGKARAFLVQDSDSGVSMGTSTMLDFPTGFTLSAWYKSNNLDTEDGGILSKISGGGGGFAGYLLWKQAGTNTIQLYINGGSRVTSAALTNNTWYYITGTWDGTTVKIYVNGVLSNSASYSTAPNSSGQTFRIGSYVDQWARNATVDDVKVYNYPRNTKQIVSDMNGGHPPVGSPVGSTIGHWKFDEGYGTTAQDSSPQNIDGTISSLANVVRTDSGKFGKALAVSSTFQNNVDFGTFSSTNGLSSLSVSLWINPSSLSTNRGIIGKFGAGADLGDWYMRTGFSSSSELVGSVCGGGDCESVNNITTNGFGLVTGTWVHIVMVYDGSLSNADRIKFYKNGVNMTTTATGSEPSSIGSSSTDTLRIGDLFGNGAAMPGSYDEVKIYNYALTADEVKIDLNRGSSTVFGSLSDNSSYEKNAANQEYCVPGDSTSCVAPVAEWRLEEGTGTTINDTSGNANSATWAGTGKRWVDGKIGKGGSFNGTSDYFTVTSRSNLDSTTFTFETWINFDNVNKLDQFLFWNADTAANWKGWGLVVNRNTVLGCDLGEICFWISDNTASYDYVEVAHNFTQSGRWYHLAGTWNDSTKTATYYVDGKLIGSAVSAINVLAGTSPTTGVADPSGTFTNFAGKMDQIRVFNYVRTPAQIAWDYNHGGPVGWWKMDQCTGSSVNDSSGSSNTGTITIGASGTQTTTGNCSTTNTAAAWYNGVAGKYNYSLNFDGTDDKIDATKYEAGVYNFATTGLTISAWVKPNSLFSSCESNTCGAIAAQGYGNHGWGAYGLYLYRGLFLASVYSPANSVYRQVGSTTQLATGRWYLATMVLDITAGKLRIYTNGIEEATVNWLGSDNFETTTAFYNNFGIGFKQANSPETYFNGQIDDARIYNYPLTATQVKVLYNQNSSVRFGPETGAP